MISLSDRTTLDAALGRLFGIVASGLDDDGIDAVFHSARPS
jgi:hypothetical protein